VWDLRRAAPRALEREYTIAAIPGSPTDAVPAGAFVLPGSYEVRLTAEGQTLRQPLTVAADPRATVPAADLASLFAFQEELEKELSRSADLAQARRAVSARLKAALERPSAASQRAAIAKVQAELDRRVPAEQTAAGINEGLSQIAADLELADAAPTAAQRAALGVLRSALDGCEQEWRRLSAGALAEVERKLAPAPKK
jgi:hypothetical protein